MKLMLAIAAWLASIETHAAGVWPAGSEQSFTLRDDVRVRVRLPPSDARWLWYMESDSRLHLALDLPDVPHERGVAVEVGVTTWRMAGDVAAWIDEDERFMSRVWSEGSVDAALLHLPTGPKTKVRWTTALHREAKDRFVYRREVLDVPEAGSVSVIGIDYVLRDAAGDVDAIVQCRTAVVATHREWVAQVEALCRQLQPRLVPKSN
jgi:hypothetical protein